MARLAIILHDGSPGWRELRLSRILDFFGVPWRFVNAADRTDLDRLGSEYAVLGSIRAIATILARHEEPNSAAGAAVGYYPHVDADRSLCSSALRSLFGEASWSVDQPPAGNLAIRVSEESAELAGAMAGLRFSLRLGSGDAVLTGAPGPG